MSSELQSLRQAVREAERRAPGISLGRVESVAADGAREMNLGSAADNVTARPMGDASGAVGDYNYLVHLGNGQAPMLWRSAPHAVGGAGATVVDV